MNNAAITLRLPDDLRQIFNVFSEKGKYRSDNAAAVYLIREALHAASPTEARASNSEADSDAQSEARDNYDDAEREMTPLEKLVDLVDTLQGEIAEMRDRFKQHSHDEKGKLRDPEGDRLAAYAARVTARRAAEAREEAGLPPEPVAVPVATAVAAPVPSVTVKPMQVPTREEDEAKWAAKRKRNQESCVAMLIGEIRDGEAKGDSVETLQATLKDLGRPEYVLSEKESASVAENDARAAAAAAELAAAAPVAMETAAPEVAL